MLGESDRGQPPGLGSEKKPDLRPDSGNRGKLVAEPPAQFTTRPWGRWGCAAPFRRDAGSSVARAGC